jgi:drug/metabolite transporter (DMT)-like permease
MEHFPVTRVFGLSGAMSLLIGALMGIGSLTLFAAYRYGKASVVTPYSQLFPIITVLAGVPLYGEQIDVVRAIGILAALAAGVILTFERQEKTELAQEQTALGD